MADVAAITDLHLPTDQDRSRDSPRIRQPDRRFVGPRAIIVEYGAGAAVKTSLLVAALDCPAEYLAVDLAGDFLSSSVSQQGPQFPGLKVGLQAADFTRDFDLPVGLCASPLGRWNAAELWTDPEQQFAVFGSVAAAPAKGE